MTLLSRILDTVFVTGLVYLGLMVGCAGIDFSAGPIAIRSGKVIVPGMVTWLFGLAAALLKGRGRSGPDRAPPGGGAATRSLPQLHLCAGLSVSPVIGAAGSSVCFACEL